MAKMRRGPHFPVLPGASTPDAVPSYARRRYIQAARPLVPVLYVSDDHLTRSLLIRMAKRWNDVDLYTTKSLGSTALLSHIRDLSPRLIIMDDYLTATSSSKLIEELQAENTIEPVPVILLVGGRDGEVVASRSGVTASFTKPLNIAAFEATMLDFVYSAAEHPKQTAT